LFDYPIFNFWSLEEPQEEGAAVVWRLHCRIIFIGHPKQVEGICESLSFGSITIKGVWDSSFELPINFDGIGD